MTFLFDTFANLFARHVLHHRPARFLTLAAFLGARLHVLVVGELLACRAALVAGFRTDRRTVLTGHHRREVFIRAFVLHVGAMSGIGVACPLAVRAGVGTGPHHLVVFGKSVLLLQPRLGQRRQSAEGEGQRHHTDNAGLSSGHGTLLFKKQSSQRTAKPITGP
jgi:hypothetical protein